MKTSMNHIVNSFHLQLIFTVIPWNHGMMEDWNNDKRPKPMFYKPENMQRKIGASPDAENVSIIFASISNIP